MRTLIRVLIIVLFSFPAFAADYYYAQSSAGSNDATSCANAKALSTLAWGTGNHGAAGNTIYLCGTITSSLTIGASGTVGNPITIKFYENAKFSKDFWAGNVIYSSGKSNIVLDGGVNGIIECLDNGDSLGHQQLDTVGVSMTLGDNLEIKNLTIQNLYVKDYQNHTNKFNGAGIEINDLKNNTSIHHNTIKHVKQAIKAANLNQASASGLYIYNNTTDHCAWGIYIPGNNTSTALSDVYVHDNNITMGANWATDYIGAEDNPYHLNGIVSYCSGLVADPCTINNYHLYNNYIQGPDDLPENFTADGMKLGTGFIFLQHLEGTGLYIYNNVLYGNTESVSNGYIYTEIIHYAAPVVANNTIIGYCNAGGCGRGIGMIRYHANTNIKVRNNIIYNVYRGLHFEPETSLDPVPTMAVDADYNLFYGNAITATFVSSYTTFAQWQGASQDAHGRSADPSLSATFHPNTADDPEVGNAENLTSLGITALNSDANSVVRPTSGAWDIGAYEYVSGGDTYYEVTPSASTGGIIIPDSVQSVISGGTTQFSYSSNGGYTFSSWGGTCGGSGTTTYTTNAITGNCTVSATFSDVTAPTVTAFTIPSTATSLTVSISTFTCTDAVGVTGYCVTTTNSSSGCLWSESAPVSVTFSAQGEQTAYGWCKDAADNVSDSVSDTVTIVIPVISNSGGMISGGGMVTGK